MAPQRPKSSKTLDLTLSDSDDSDVVVEVPVAKKARSSPRKKPERKMQQQEEDDDALLAGLLQAEEDERAMQQDNGVGSSKAATSRATRASPRKSTSSSALNELQSTSSSDDPLQILSTHRKLFIGSCVCKCGARVAPSSPPSLSDKDALLATATLSCSKCKASLCRGCGEPSADGATCCSAGRLTVIYELLGMLDTAFLVEHLQKPIDPALRPQAKKARGKPTGKGAGTGYGSGAASTYAANASVNHLQAVMANVAGGQGQAVGGHGTGYGFDDNDEGFSDEYGYESSEDEYMYHQQPRVAPAVAPRPENPKDVEEEKLYTSGLKTLAQLLPRPDHPDANIYDYLPHEALPSLLIASTLGDLLSQLLRNDSVLEWSKRADLYFALLELVSALGGSESSLPFLFGDERPDKAWSEGLFAWMRKEGQIMWERKAVQKPKGRGKKRKANEAEPEGDLIFAASLYSLLKRLVTQAEAFRAAATTGEISNADVALVGICGDFSTAGERTKATLRVWLEMQERNSGAASAMDGKGKRKAILAADEEWTEKDYMKASEALSYASIELGSAKVGGGKTFLTHHYNSDIIKTASSNRPHFMSLARELAILSTSLPPGAFLRADEERIDVIKCLMAGPVDSPYALGLFEFDIFLPLQYPQVPPQVWLKTTGGGKVRFNPNLYAEGKVCLSLLGTWPGRPDEMWQPGQSTLLQVLMSILSMILGTQFPFYNEPGFGAPKNDKRNKDYNANCSLATARWAIINWMDDSFQQSIWADVIYAHFKLNQVKIRSQLAAWAAADSRMHDWQPIHNSVAGTHNLTPYNYAGANQQQLPGMVLGGDPMAMQAMGGGAAALGVGAGGGAFTGTGHSLTGAMVSNGAAGGKRDLVKEFEERLKVVDKWRSESWLRELLV